MKFTKTPIIGAYIIDLEKKEDNRGFFARIWEQKVFKKKGLEDKIIDVDISSNPKMGTLRGMHFQEEPFSEVKVVTCAKGAIFDVILDLRPKSKTYKEWFGVELNTDNHKAIYIPKNCAHGFITLVDNTEVFYLVSQSYSSESARGIRFNDPSFGIKWPMKVKIISKKDKNWPDY